MKLIPDSFKLFTWSSSYRSGLKAEFLARWYLRIHGYSILKSRYVTGRYTGRAEIDIIARRKNIIIFIEVKNRPDAESGIRAVTFTQGTRLRRAAQTYLAQYAPLSDARFDIIVVSKFRIKHFKNSV